MRRFRRNIAQSDVKDMFAATTLEQFAIVSYLNCEIDQPNRMAEGGAIDRLFEYRAALSLPPQPAR